MAGLLKSSLMLRGRLRTPDHLRWLQFSRALGIDGTCSLMNNSTESLGTSSGGGVTLAYGSQMA